MSAPSAQSTNGRLHHYQVVSGGDINGLTHPDQQRRRAYGSLSIANCSDRIRDRFRPLRNRSRARLTAGVPGTEHLTRHLVTYGAYTGRLIDECGVDAAGDLRYALEDQLSALFRLSRLDLALGVAATVTQSISGASERPEYRVLSISHVVWYHTVLIQPPGRRADAAGNLRQVSTTGLAYHERQRARATVTSISGPPDGQSTGN